MAEYLAKIDVGSIKNCTTGDNDCTLVTALVQALGTPSTQGYTKLPLFDNGAGAPAGVANGNLWAASSVTGSYDMFFRKGGVDETVILEDYQFAGDMTGTPDVTAVGSHSGHTASDLPDVEGLDTSEMTTTKVLNPDGVGGLAWAAPAGGGFGADNFTVVDATNDTADLNTALSTYDVVYAEPGTYSSVTGKVTVPDNTQFVALGGGSYNSGATYAPRFDLTTSPTVFFAMGVNSLIQGMYFEFNASSTDNMIQCASGSGIVRYCYFNGHTTGTAYYGVEGAYKEVSHCNFVSCYGVTITGNGGDPGGVTEISYLHWIGYSSDTTANNKGVNVAAPSVHIHDCEFENGAYGIYNNGNDDCRFSGIRCYRVDDATYAAGVYSTGDRCTISDIWVRAANVGNAYGLYLDGGYLNLSDIYVFDTSNNGIIFGSSADYLKASGLYIYDCGDAQSENGIEFVGCNRPTVTNVTAYGCGDNGIYLQTCLNGSFTGITADTNAGNGIRVNAGNQNLTFSSVTACSNTSDGIDVGASQDGLHFDGVTAMSNTGYGFLAGNSGVTRVCRLSACHALANGSGQISLGTNWDDYSAPGELPTGNEGDVLVCDGGTGYTARGAGTGDRILDVLYATSLDLGTGLDVGTYLKLRSDRLRLGNQGASTPGTPLEGDAWWNNSGFQIYDGAASRTFVHSNTSLAGDVTGTPGATVVGKLHGKDVVSGTPTDNDILQYDSSSGDWEHREYQPHYDSGWFSVSTDTQYTKTHGLGVIPKLIQIYWASSATPSTVYQMGWIWS